MILGHSLQCHSFVQNLHGLPYTMLWNECVESTEFRVFESSGHTLLSSFAQHISLFCTKLLKWSSNATVLCMMQMFMFIVLILFFSKCFHDGFYKNIYIWNNKYHLYSFETLWLYRRHHDLSFHVTFNTDMPNVIIMCLYQICSVKAALVSSFKHLPDPRGTRLQLIFACS